MESILALATLILCIIFILCMPDRFCCYVGCHKWSHPGGHCEDCGLRDNFFD